MSRKPSTTTKSTTLDNSPLSLAEENAYANLVLIAIEHANDNDKRRLLKAGLIPDPNAPKQLTSIDAKQTAVAVAKGTESPLAPPQWSHTREMCKRWIIARANGDTYRRAVKAAGVEWADIQHMRWSDPAFAAAFSFVERERQHLLAAKASDALESLIDGDETAAARNAKVVMFTLERLKRDQFSDPKKHTGASDGGKGGGTTYNINLQVVQTPSAPNLCGKCEETSPSQAIIEIKGE